MRFYFDITTAQYAGSAAIGSIRREEIVRNWFDELDRARYAQERACGNVLIGPRAVSNITCVEHEPKPPCFAPLGPDDGREPFSAGAEPITAR
jgi:hypothetical protein